MKINIQMIVMNRKKKKIRKTKKEIKRRIMGKKSG